MMVTVRSAKIFSTLQRTRYKRNPSKTKELLTTRLNNRVPTWTKTKKCRKMTVIHKKWKKKRKK